MNTPSAIVRFADLPLGQAAAATMATITTTTTTTRTRVRTGVSS